jgi:hypothetical protein
MVRIEVGFLPQGFEKRLVAQTKEDLQARLAGHDLEDVKIVLKKLPTTPIMFQFIGESDAVEKTKALLGIY